MPRRKVRRGLHQLSSSSSALVVHVVEARLGRSVAVLFVRRLADDYLLLDHSSSHGAGKLPARRAGRFQYRGVQAVFVLVITQVNRRVAGARAVVVLVSTFVEQFVEELARAGVPPHRLGPVGKGLADRDECRRFVALVVTGRETALSGARAPFRTADGAPLGQTQGGGALDPRADGRLLLRARRQRRVGRGLHAELIVPLRVVSGLFLEKDYHVRC